MKKRPARGAFSIHTCSLYIIDIWLLPLYNPDITPKPGNLLFRIFIIYYENNSKIIPRCSVHRRTHAHHSKPSVRSNEPPKCKLVFFELIFVKQQLYVIVELFVTPKCVFTDSAFKRINCSDSFDIREWPFSTRSFKPYSDCFDSGSQWHEHLYRTSSDKRHCDIGKSQCLLSDLTC